VKYPDPKKPTESVLEFRKYAARFRLTFYLVCDFESFLTPIDRNEDVDAIKATNLIDEHNVCGFARHRISEYPKYQTDPIIYSGPGVIDKFYEHVMRESQIISDILADDQDMYPLTDTQQADYDDTTTCVECGEDFTKSNHKVRHHDHVTGQYLFPACNNCKLPLKMPNRKRKVTENQRSNKKPKFEKGYRRNAKYVKQRARKCLYGVAKPISKVYTPIFLKTVFYGLHFDETNFFSPENGFNIGRLESRRPVGAQ